MAWSQSSLDPPDPKHGYLSEYSSVSISGLLAIDTNLMIPRAQPFGCGGFGGDMTRWIQQKLVLAVAALLAACSGGADKPADGGTKSILLGFSQIGAESEWRTANTRSIQTAAAEEGITLRFSDAQQKQENQIKALRSFIAQRVDVIAFSPVVETGWETVLREAQAAKIPVILTDRAVDVTDDTLYLSLIGSDFVEEGRKAGRWLLENYPKNASVKDSTGGDVNIVELQGTVGSAPANDRRKGFAEVIANDARYKIIRSQTGDFTRAKGKEVMEAFLKAEGRKINVLFAHNDDMAIG